MISSGLCNAIWKILDKFSCHGHFNAIVIPIGYFMWYFLCWYTKYFIHDEHINSYSTYSMVVVLEKFFYLQDVSYIPAVNT